MRQDAIKTWKQMNNESKLKLFEEAFEDYSELKTEMETKRVKGT